MRATRGPALSVLLAAIWLVAAGRILYGAYSRMVDECRTELIGVEPAKGDPR